MIRWQEEGKHERSAVRIALEEMMKFNAAWIADDHDFPDRELFEAGDQEKDGWTKVCDIQVGWETARVWEHREDSRLIVVLSDGGNEDNVEVWQTA